MATKLNSSLRNSVNAEKKAAETKPLTVKSVMAKKPQISKSTSVPLKNAANPTSPAKARPTTKPAPNKAKIAVDAKPADPSKNPTVKKDSPAKDKPELNATFNSNKLQSAFLEKYNLDSVQNTLQKVSSLNNYALENFLTVNQDIYNYLQQISSISSLSRLYQVNLEFYSLLRKRQQEVLSKNMEVLSILKIDKFQK